MSTARDTKASDERLDAVFRALGDGTRRRIVAKLSHGPSSVGDLASPFSISLAAVSKHLDVLENAGLVHRERDGRFQRCHLTPGPLGDAADFIERYRSFWDATLDRLAVFVEQGSAGAEKSARVLPASNAKRRSKKATRQ